MKKCFSPLLANKVLRKQILQIVEESKLFNFSIALLVVLNVLSTIIGTLPHFKPYSFYFLLFEYASAIIFLFEYMMRVYSCVEQEEYKKVLNGRIKFMLKPLMIVDFLAFAPFFITFGGIDLSSMRMLRVARVLRLLKIRHFHHAFEMILSVIWERRQEFYVSGVILFIITLVGSTMMFYAENVAQPEVFVSILDSMWYTIVTITTIGYGDMVPVTVQGKVIAGFLSITGICVMALPIGLFTAGFMNKTKSQRLENTPVNCPHCQKSFFIRKTDE